MALEQLPRTPLERGGAFSFATPNRRPAGGAAPATLALALAPAPTPSLLPPPPLLHPYPLAAKKSAAAVKAQAVGEAEEVVEEARRQGKGRVSPFEFEGLERLKGGGPKALPFIRGTTDTKVEGGGKGAAVGGKGGEVA